MSDNVSRYGWTSDTGVAKVDHVTYSQVIFRFYNDKPIDDPVEEIVVGTQGAAWEEDWLVKQVEDVVVEDWHREHEDSEPLYNISVNRQRSNWGADQSTFSIWVDLGIGIAGSAIWDLTKLAARKMAARLKGVDGHSLDRPLTVEEISERTNWLLCRRFGLKWDDLKLISTDVKDGAASVILVDRNATYYYCSFLLIDGLIDMVRFRRAVVLDHDATATDVSD